MSILEGSSILVTGGTGSFGKAFITEVLKNHNPKRVVIFSRDELKQYELNQRLRDPRLRLLLGDVRDADRLRVATREVNSIPACSPAAAPLPGLARRAANRCGTLCPCVSTSASGATADRRSAWAT